MIARFPCAVSYADVLDRDVDLKPDAIDVT